MSEDKDIEVLAAHYKWTKRQTERIEQLVKDKVTDFLYWYQEFDKETCEQIYDIYKQHQKNKSLTK